MCFRPADVDGGPSPIDCECGETIFPTDGIFPSKCPYCAKPLVQAAAPAVAPPSAAGAQPPAAPKAPASPGVPKAPASPAAPKAPPKDQE